MLGYNSDVDSIFKAIERTCGVTDMDLETAGLLEYVADLKNVLTINRILKRIEVREDIEYLPHKKNYFMKAVRTQISESKKSK